MTDGMTVKSLFQRISAATYCFSQIMLNPKLFCEFEKWLYIFKPYWSKIAPKEITVKWDLTVEAIERPPSPVDSPSWHSSRVSPASLAVTFLLPSMEPTHQQIVHPIPWRTAASKEVLLKAPPPCLGMQVHYLAFCCILYLGDHILQCSFSRLSWLVGRLVLM